MTDLKALAYELLGEAQSILQHEGHVNPAAVVITPSENLIFDLEFETDDERDELYSEMMDVAGEKNASAILTVNDVYLVGARCLEPRGRRLWSLFLVAALKHGAL
jgi:ribose 5-phosphate isomerase